MTKTWSYNTRIYRKKFVDENDERTSSQNKSYLRIIID